MQHREIIQVKPFIYKEILFAILYFFFLYAGSSIHSLQCICLFGFLSLVFIRNRRKSTWHDFKMKRTLLMFNLGIFNNWKKIVARNNQLARWVRQTGKQNQILNIGHKIKQTKFPFVRSKYINNFNCSSI